MTELRSLSQDCTRTVITSNVPELAELGRPNWVCTWTSTEIDVFTFNVSELAIERVSTGTDLVRLSVPSPNSTLTETMKTSNVTEWIRLSGSICDCTGISQFPKFDTELISNEMELAKETS